MIFEETRLDLKNRYYLECSKQLKLQSVCPSFRDLLLVIIKLYFNFFIFSIRFYSKSSVLCLFFVKTIIITIMC